MTMIRKQMQVVALVCGLAAGLPQAVAAPPAGPAHAHPTEGPHLGALIELGKEDYHAELVHDEKTDTITVYILDATARKPVPITAKELMLNLKAGNKPYQFPLKACPQAGEPAGVASAFGATDKTSARRSIPTESQVVSTWRLGARSTWARSPDIRTTTSTSRRP